MEDSIDLISPIPLQGEVVEELPPRPPFWAQLRFRVITPYLALALILAVAGTFFLARIFAERLHERLLTQLWEAGHYATDEVVYIERELLTSLRAIARTQGVAQAVQGNDRQTLYHLIYPIALNGDLDLVEITAPDGTILLSLHRENPPANAADYAVTSGDSLHDWYLVQQVAAGRVDDIGDKFADLVHAPWGWCFYISGPIKEDGKLVGTVLVGMHMPRMVERMAGKAGLTATRLTRLPTGREVTIYDSEGQIIATTIADAPVSALQISPDWYGQVVQAQDFRYLGRRIPVHEGEVEEAFGSFDARHGADLAVFSVAVPSQQREQALTQIALAALFSLAVVAVVLVGIWVSARIVRPILELVHAARQVERGELLHKVVVSTEDEIGLLGHAFNRMVQGLRVKEYIRDAFGRFVSRDVSESILQGRIRLQGEKRVTSMLFADIRDFTRLSEEYAPDAMVRILNEYFTAMVEVAQSFGGTVNKFGGDSTLVIFGAPVHHHDHADRAVRSALKMRRRLAQLNAERVTRGEVPIRMGIGINTGEVVAGTVGSVDRMEYTVIGDAVNLSARVQGLNKEFPEYDILISEYTHTALQDRESYSIRNLGAMSLKGKSEPVGIFAIVGPAEQVDEGQAGT